jgi:hypothetical protein
MSMTFAPPQTPAAPGLNAFLLQLAAVLNAAISCLAANVAMTNANTFYDGPTITIGQPGTYLVIATLLINFTGNNVTAKIHDGTNQYAAGAGPGGVGNNYIQIPMIAFVKVQSTPLTLRAAAASTAAGNTILSQPPANSPANGISSCIFAMRVAQ